MLSPPKDRPSGRLGRLLAALRPSRAGPLPVQTGFPTSLADLVVKNHGRLKKQPSPSSKRGKRGAAASPTPSPSPSPSTSPTPPPASPPPLPSPAVVSPLDRPRSDLPPAVLARRGKGGSFGLGLGFLAAIGVVSLALLVIWSKKVVAAVTVASFLLFLLESVRPRSFPRRPRPAVTERRLYLDGRGRVSPIRELDAETETETEPSRTSCSDSDRGSEASVLAVKANCGVLDEPINRKAKAKKGPWKKLIAGAKRLHKGRKSREPDSPGSSSFRSEGGRVEDDAARRGVNAKATDPSGSRRGTANQTEVAAEDAVAKEPDSSRGSRRSQGTETDAPPVEIDAPPVDLIEEEGVVEEGSQAGIGFPALAVVAVVLVGLVVGKLQAVALTVLCYAFFGSAQRLAGGGGGGSSPARRPDVSRVVLTAVN